MSKKKVNASEPKPGSVDRRGFLKSFLGLTAVSEQQSAALSAPAAGNRAANFFWANLQNGQIAFPTGMGVPSGQLGSLMKLVTAATLRECGFFTGDETIECRGSITIAGHTFRCLHPHGKVGVIEAIGLSCNVFFAEASQKLTASAIIDYARRFGLDRPVSGFAGERFPEQPSASVADYALGLADDLLPNALQILQLVALVGLSGKLPPLHNAADDASLHSPFSLELQPATWQALQQGMRIADRQGTASKLDPQDTLRMAVKTGTAPHGKSFQSWIAGYFPCDQPRYAFCLRAAAGTSQDSAVPEAHRFLFAAPWP